MPLFNRKGKLEQEKQGPFFIEAGTLQGEEPGQVSEMNRIVDQITVKNLRVNEGKITYDWSGIPTAEADKEVSSGSRTDYRTVLQVKMVPVISKDR
jgi:hypothetical protein